MSEDQARDTEPVGWRQEAFLEADCRTPDEDAKPPAGTPPDPNPTGPRIPPKQKPFR